MNNYVVYKHTNKINGKCYIGLTKNIKRRWVGKGQAYSECPVFFKALKKYGWDNFEHEILAENLTAEQAKQKETEFILSYRSNETAYGYNLTNGADLNVPNEEVKEKIRRTKSNMSEEQLQNIKKAAQQREIKYKEQGRQNSFKGRKHSEETKKKMKQNQWSKTNPQKFYEMIHRKRRSEASLCTKSIVRIIDEKCYTSIRDCAEENNRHPATITNHCLNKCKIKEFMFKDDYVMLSNYEKQNLKAIIQDKQVNPSKYQYKSKAIIDLLTKKIYYSIADCTKELHKDIRTIHKHCKGFVKSPRFAYIEDYKEDING